MISTLYNYCDSENNDVTIFQIYVYFLVASEDDEFEETDDSGDELAGNLNFLTLFS